MVNGQAGHYNVTPDALIQLKKAGLSDKIINAMVTKASGGPAPAAPTATPVATAAPLVDEIGIYYKKDDKWVEMQPEIVNWKTGGFLKSFASEGVVKGDVNGHLEGKSAKMSVTTPLDFLIYTPDGTAPTEYQLLHLRVSGNAREFRSTTGGVVHSSSGAQRQDEVDFESTKIAPAHLRNQAGAGLQDRRIRLPPPARRHQLLEPGQLRQNV